MRQMGVEVTMTEDEVLVSGVGLHGLRNPSSILYTGNSGTTTRLLSGILCGQSFSSAITGDKSIEKRPMKRIIEPLSQMGASIMSKSGNGCAPLMIGGTDESGPLHGISYNSPVASAQVKSSILFAGMYADSPTTVTEPTLSRDHTERMALSFGADITTDGCAVTILPEPDLQAQEIVVPGDISSAAFFIVAALIHPDAELVIKNVGCNPTRSGIIDVAKLMGGSVIVENSRMISQETVSDITVKSSSLHGIEIGGDMIPTLIDEIPIIAVMAACAEGETVIKDASELRVKESDRIASICDNLRLMGADVTANADGMTIRGGRSLSGGTIRTASDHRIAMAFTVASLVSDSSVFLDDPDCVSISYPGFYDTMAAIVEK
jgi:3-phosphoshikimate 1-carboxyvinyltransferase